MTKQEGILKWNKCLDIIKNNLDEAQYQAFFATIVAYDFKGNDLYLQVPSMFFIEQIESNYLNLLSKTIKRVYETDINLYYKYDVVGKKEEADNADNSSITLKQAKNASLNPFYRQTMPEIDSRLNMYNTFENY